MRRNECHVLSLVFGQDLSVVFRETAIWIPQEHHAVHFHLEPFRE